jgi:protein SCO1/2
VPHKPKKHLKLLLLLLSIFVLIPIVAIYFGIMQHHGKVNPKDIKIEGAYLTPAKEIIEFNLIDNTGKAFTNANLKGQWTMMFFGFTNCGMVCPTTLSALNKMYQLLQHELPDKQLPQVVMVSVDPERDTVEKMNSYVKAFNPHFIGASGKMPMTLALEKNLHVVAVKVQGESKKKNDYYYDHSAEIMLVNPQGKVQAYLSYPHKPENLATEYKLIKASI